MMGQLYILAVLAVTLFHVDLLPSTSVPSQDPTSTLEINFILIRILRIGRLATRELEVTQSVLFQVLCIFGIERAGDASAQ